MIKIIIAILLQLSFYTICAQNNLSYHTILYMNCSICRTEYSREIKIEMTRTKDNLKVVFKVLDSLQITKLKNTPEYKELTKMGLQTKVDSTFHAKFLRLKELYSVYFQDSLLLLKSENLELFENADLVALSDEKFIAEMNSSNNRAVFDANYLKVTINGMNNITNSYWVKQPSELSTPISYKLMTGLLNAYRTKKTGTILEKGVKTFYY